MLVKKLPINSLSTIRIKFPDDYVLQGNFSPSDPLKKVYEYVSTVKLIQMIVNPKAKFVLFVTPPRKNLIKQ